MGKEIQTPVVSRQTIVYILVPCFLLFGTALSSPDKLTISEFNSNNFLAQQNDNSFNYSKILLPPKLENLSWKNIEEITPEYQIALENYMAPDGIPQRYVYYLAGHDHEDRPLWIIEGGKWNIMEGVMRGQKKEMEIYFMQMVLRFFNSILDSSNNAFMSQWRYDTFSSTAENPVTEIAFLLDFADLDFAQIRHVPTLSYALGIASKTFHLIEKYAADSYIINANFATLTLMNLVKPFWGASFSKVTVYGNNKATWMPKILKALPKESIPSWYGGEKDYKPIKVYG